MASYIPSVTDSPQSLQTPIYTEDYSFLQNQLQKSDQQYNAGLQKVANDYSAITSQQLTNPENQGKQQEYIAKIQEGLKKVAPTDLSLPQNVSQAESLYQPFWKDTDMLTDIGRTKEHSSNKSQIEAMKMSPDEKVRDMYDSYQEQYNDMIVQDLKDAHRGDGSFQRIASRDIVPFKNAQKTLNAAAKDANLEVDWTDPKGPVLYEYKNGEKAVRPFTLFAKGILGRDFDAQFKVMGEVDKRNTENYYRQQGYDKQTASQIVGEHFYKSYVEGLNQSIQTNGNHNQTNEAAIKMLEHKVSTQGGATPVDSDELIKLYSQRNDFKAEANDYADKLKEVQDPQTGRVILEHPENYIASHIKDNVINNWAVGRAEGTKSVKEVANQAWKNVEDVKLASGNLSARWSEIGETGRHNRAEEDLKGVKNAIDAFSAGYDNSVPGGQKPLISPNSIIANSSNELAQLNSADVAIGIQRENRRQLVQSVWSVGGLTSVLRAGNAMSTDEIATLNTYMADIESGQKPSTTPEIQSTINKFTSVLRGAGIEVPKSSNDFKEYANDFRGKLSQYALGLANNNKLHLSPDYVKDISAKAIKADALQRVYQANVEQTAASISNIISKPENAIKYSGVIINRNGKADLVHPEDIASTLPQSIELEEVGSSGKTLHLSAMDIANARYTNQFDVYNQGQENKGIATPPSGVKYNGKLYYVNKINGQNFVPQSKPAEHTWAHPNLLGWETGEPSDIDYRNAYDQSSGALRSYLNKSEEKFGKPEDFKNKMNELTRRAIPGFADKTGLMGKRSIIDYTDPRSYRVLRDGVQPDNIAKVYDNNGKDITDENILKALYSIASSKNEDIKKFVAPPYVDFTGRTGTPTLEIRINSSTGESDNSDIKALGSNTYHLVINPETASPYLRQILDQAPVNMSLFPEIAKGKTYTSETYGGMNFTVTPSEKRPNPSGYTLEVNRKGIDPKTGESISLPVYSTFQVSSNATGDYMVNGGIKAITEQQNKNVQDNQMHVTNTKLIPLLQIQQQFKGNLK